FFCMPGSTMLRLAFSVGWPGFGKYDPGAGKQMVLQVARRNMDKRFRFDIPGLKQVNPNTYVAEVKGLQSLSAPPRIPAPPAGALGKRLKGTLVIPPKAGGKAREPESGLPPVYVKVRPGSTLWIVSYALNDKDEQFVALDKDGTLPHSGPAGIPEQL